MHILARYCLTAIFVTFIVASRSAAADEWKTLDDTIAKVTASESANPDGSYRYQYAVTNLDSTRRLKSLEVGFEMGADGLELTTLPVSIANADADGDVPITVTSGTSPDGWSAATIQFNEGSEGHSLNWTVQDGGTGIAPGTTVVGYAVTLPTRDVGHLNAHWTVTFNLGPAAASRLTPGRLPVYAINCGGGGVGTFTADAFNDGDVAGQTQNAVDLSNVVDPAPTAVYQSARGGGNVT